MKKESNEALEAYKIRIDALEIINEAHLAKIEALELLNRNLQFLRDVRNQIQHAARPLSPAPSVLAPGEKRGRGRPRKYPIGTNAASIKSAAQNYTGKKRGRKPKGYYDAFGQSETKSAPVQPTGEKRGRGRPRKSESAPVNTTVIAAREENKRGRKPKNSSITRLQVPLDAALREMLKDEGFNKATFRALTGILLCLFENNTATVTTLHEFIGGSRVTVVRHTALLKKMKLLVYEGSRKKGNYALTPQGHHLYEKLLNA